MPRTFVANGNIRPSRAVKLDTTSVGRVVVAVDRDPGNPATITALEGNLSAIRVG